MCFSLQDFFKYSLESVVRTFDTFQNNFGINHKFTKYLKESCGFDFNQHFSFKYFLKKCFCLIDFSKIIRLFLASVSINELIGNQSRAVTGVGINQELLLTVSSGPLIIFKITLELIINSKNIWRSVVDLISINIFPLDIFWKNAFVEIFHKNCQTVLASESINKLIGHHRRGEKSQTVRWLYGRGDQSTHPGWRKWNEMKYTVEKNHPTQQR